MDEGRERKRPGRPKGRKGGTWSAYVSGHTIAVLESAARLRGVAVGKYLDSLVLALEGLGVPALDSPEASEAAQTATSK